MIPGGLPDTVQNAISLQYPDAAAIEAAYRELPKRGVLYLSCGTDDLARILRDCEAAGFYGMQVNAQGLAARHLEVRAFKGKQGPCFETGRSAELKSTALAALDDDNHLIRGAIRVCEKTGSLYSRDPYDEWVQVTEAEQELSDRLLIDPVPFDCDTLEADARDLRQAVGEIDRGERVPLLYPGPFKVLVLADGSILRRGQTTPVPVGQVDELKRNERCVVLPAEAPTAEIEFFQEAYDDRGAACLLGDLPLTDTFQLTVQTDLTAIDRCGADFAERLRQWIDRGDKQIVLTGSDPRIQYGCCPSDDVYEANRLAEAGVLDLYRAPAPPGSCPTTIYAFRGELGSADGKPVVTVDQAFRQQVRQALEHTGPTGGESGGIGGAGKRTLRWGLLLLATAALVWGMLRQGGGFDDQPVYGFPPPGTEQLVVAFYHPHKRCEPCEAIERLSGEVVSEHFDAAVTAGRLAYEVVDIGEEGRRAADVLDLYTSTIALLAFKGPQRAPDLQVAEWVWEHELLDEPVTWKERLAGDIDQMLRGVP